MATFELVQLCICCWAIFRASGGYTSFLVLGNPAKCQPPPSPHTPQNVNWIMPFPAWPAEDVMQSMKTEGETHTGKGGGGKKKMKGKASSSSLPLPTKGYGRP